MVYHDDVLLGNYSLTHTYQSHNVISLLADNDRNQANVKYWNASR